MLKKQEKYNIAIIGATGIVGESLLSILNDRSFPINNIHACLLYTSPSPRDVEESRMPSSA